MNIGDQKKQALVSFGCQNTSYFRVGFLWLEKWKPEYKGEPEGELVYTDGGGVYTSLVNWQWNLARAKH
jgi:hypothetical protein